MIDLSESYRVDGYIDRITPHVQEFGNPKPITVLIQINNEEVEVEYTDEIFLGQHVVMTIYRDIKIG